jgi:hypothetical protein
MSRSSQALVAAMTLSIAGARYVAAEPAMQAKLVTPIYGEANIVITKPVTKVQGKDIVTTLFVKNVDAAPIAGLIVDQYWYDLAGTPLGADRYRHPRPLQAGEVIQVTIKTPRDSKMNRNKLGFSHAHGAIKQKIVPKLELPK